MCRETSQCFIMDEKREIKENYCKLYETAVLTLLFLCMTEDHRH